MDESRFNQLADEMMGRIEAVLDRTDFDFEIKPGGVVEIDFGGGGKIIVNRHTAAQEIWVAARSGGYHFKFEKDAWTNTRDNMPLFDVLSRCMTEQSGEAIKLGDI